MSGGRNTTRVLMVEPRGFRSNEETLLDNAFQQELDTGSVSVVEKQALEEFTQLVELLRSEGVNVNTFAPALNCTSPDVVFPSHWFSTHAQLGGVFVVYPLRSPRRRTERSLEIINFLRRRYPIHIDLTAYDSRGEYLESLGSLVVDRTNRLVYLASSRRSSERLAERWATLLGYRLLVFDASDKDGRPIYHTSALMGIGDSYVVICAEALSEDSLSIVQSELALTDREVIEITREQMMAFCANCVQLGTDGGRLIVMSTGAYNMLTAEQRALFENHGRIVHSDITTIETYGGGSTQSMIAELM